MIPGGSQKIKEADGARKWRGGIRWRQLLMGDK